MDADRSICSPSPALEWPSIDEGGEARDRADSSDNSDVGAGTGAGCLDLGIACPASCWQQQRTSLNLIPSTEWGNIRLSMSSCSSDRDIF